jgi:ABC-type nitrate/sulfonate/bicarbonate transport system substrate-binding protein
VSLLYYSYRTPTVKQDIDLLQQQTKIKQGKNTMKKIPCIVIAAVLFFMTTHSQVVTEVKILRQPGQLSNMPLLYTTVEKFEKKAQAQGHNIKVVLQPLGNVSDGVTSMLAGNTDIIMGGLIPFFLANEKAPNRLLLLSGSMVNGYAIVCNNEQINTLEDLLKAKKIAMKNVGSSEQYFLMQLSKIITKEYHSLDSKIITMPRNQMPSAFKTKDIDCAIPGSPIEETLIKTKQAKALDIGNNKVVDIIYGTFTTRSWAEKNKTLLNIWIDSVRESAQELTEDPRAALKKFKENDGINDTIEQLVESLKQTRQRHSHELVGVSELVDLLKNLDKIKDKTFSIESVLWQNSLAK